jgi:hypothetical protein
MVLAGMVNLVIGPRNALPFLSAFFLLGFSWLILACVDMHLPANPPFFVGRQGSLFAAWKSLRRVSGWWCSLVMSVFLCLTAATFVLFAIAILYFVVTRTPPS